MTEFLDVVDLGRRAYADALELQRAVRQARIAGAVSSDVLLLVEHDPVYTLGRSTRATSIPADTAALRARGADVVEIERGGDVTWHGPGQLVGYPVLDLAAHRQDLHWYLRTLEHALIDALATLGIPAEREAGHTGVWTDGRKIASIGIHVRQWVTLHGFALNVDPDLSWFDAIVPCGIHGVVMTSVAGECARQGRRSASHHAVREAVIAAIGAAFSRTPRRVTAQELEHAVAALLPEGAATA